MESERLYMNTNLIEELSKFYYESVKGIYISEYKKLNNGVVVYSDMIKDHFSNYIQMDSITKDSFYKEWKENRKKLVAKDRKATLYVFPITTHFIYWCKLGINIGSEQNKLRPVIIVRSQTNSPICTILPLTSVRMNDSRWYHIDLEWHNSTALIEHLRNVSKLRILKPQRENGRIARISQKDVDNINKAIQSYYKLPSIPSN